MKCNIDVSEGNADERYGQWYLCLQCRKDNITTYYDYCPSCGKEIIWWNKDKIIFSKTIFNKFIDINKMIKRSPDTWEKMLDILVMDPDGWNRSNFTVDWKKKLTLGEFIRKTNMSTTQFRSMFYQLLLQRLEKENV